MVFTMMSTPSRSSCSVIINAGENLSALVPIGFDINPLYLISLHNLYISDTPFEHLTKNQIYSISILGI